MGTVASVDYRHLASEVYEGSLLIAVHLDPRVGVEAAFRVASYWDASDVEMSPSIAAYYAFWSASPDGDQKSSYPGSLLVAPMYGGLFDPGEGWGLDGVQEALAKPESAVVAVPTLEAAGSVVRTLREHVAFRRILVAVLDADGAYTLCPLADVVKRAISDVSDDQARADHPVAFVDADPVPLRSGAFSSVVVVGGKVPDALRFGLEQAFQGVDLDNAQFKYGFVEDDSPASISFNARYDLLVASLPRAAEYTDYSRKVEGLSMGFYDAPSFKRAKQDGCDIFFFVLHSRREDARKAYDEYMSMASRLGIPCIVYVPDIFTYMELARMSFASKSDPVHYYGSVRVYVDENLRRKAHVNAVDGYVCEGYSPEFLSMLQERKSFYVVEPFDSSKEEYFERTGSAIADLLSKNRVSVYMGCGRTNYTVGESKKDLSYMQFMTAISKLSDIESRDGDVPLVLEFLNSTSLSIRARSWREDSSLVPPLPSRHHSVTVLSSRNIPSKDVTPGRIVLIVHADSITTNDLSRLIHQTKADTRIRIVVYYAGFEDFESDNTVNYRSLPVGVLRNTLYVSASYRAPDNEILAALVY